MRIKSRLLNRIIDKADGAFTKSSKILPPNKPVGWRMFGHEITQLEIAVVAIATVMGLGFAWLYGSIAMFFIFVGTFVMMALWML
jgi:hypothetical protein